MKRLIRLLGAVSLFMLLFTVRIQPAHADSCVLANVSYNNAVTVNVPIGHSSDLLIYQDGVFHGDVPGFFTYRPWIITASTLGVRYVLLDTSAGCPSGPVTYFNPGDARLDGQPGDRIAVYCNKATDGKPANLAVFGINSSSIGTQIADPNLSDIPGTGKSFSDGTGGKVFIGGQAPTFVIQWVNSSVGATGQGDFAKTVTCTG